jgi:hypothetical protein
MGELMTNYAPLITMWAVEQPHTPPRLLTTRTRITVAVCVTAFVLALAVLGGLHLGHTESGWLLPLDFVLHGWPLIAANVAWYGYLCWLSLCFIRETAGRERLVVVGWCLTYLVWPVEVLRPEWAGAIRYVGILMLSLALLAALSLLLRASSTTRS